MWPGSRLVTAERDGYFGFRAKLALGAQKSKFIMRRTLRRGKLFPEPPDANWLSFLLSQITNVPFLIVYCVGIVLALLFWKRHPAVSILCIVAFLILLGALITGIGTQIWMTTVASREMRSEEIGRFLSLMGIVRAGLSTVAWALLLTALFGWRSPVAPRSAV